MEMAKVVAFPEAAGMFNRTLTELLDMSQAILQCARAGDWAAALELQAKRRQELEQFFARSPVPGEAGVVAEAIRTMLDIDAQVTEIVYSHRQSLMTEASQVRRGHVAVQAYLSQTE